MIDKWNALSYAKCWTSPIYIYIFPVIILAPSIEPPWGIYARKVLPALGSLFCHMSNMNPNILSIFVNNNQSSNS